MMNPFQFLQESRNEIRKVVWPTRNETVVSTIMVVIMVTLMTSLFALVDFVWRVGLKGLINLFT